MTLLSSAGNKKRRHSAHGAQSEIPLAAPLGSGLAFCLGHDCPKNGIRQKARPDPNGPVVKLARHLSRLGAHETVRVLYEPHILWMNEDRFVLTGFERVGEGNNAADYAQSWLCKLGTD